MNNQTTSGNNPEHDNLYWQKRHNYVNLLLEQNLEPARLLNILERLDNYYKAERKAVKESGQQQPVELLKINLRVANAILETKKTLAVASPPQPEPARKDYWSSLKTWGREIQNSARTTASDITNRLAFEWNDARRLVNENIISPISDAYDRMTDALSRTRKTVIKTATDTYNFAHTSLYRLSAPVSAFMILNIGGSLQTPTPPDNPEQPPITTASTHDNFNNQSQPILIPPKKTQLTNKKPPPRSAPPSNKQGTDHLRQSISESIETWLHNNKHKQYKWGGNSTRYVDCSTFVKGGLEFASKNLNKEHGVEINLRGIPRISSRITNAFASSGRLLTGNQINSGTLKAGMIIALDTGPKKWDHGRWKGIDHIAIIYEKKDGQLYVAESASGKGVASSKLTSWLAYAQKRRYNLFAADILSRLSEKPTEETTEGTTLANTAKPLAVTYNHRAAPSLGNTRNDTENELLKAFREHQGNLRSDENQGITVETRQKALEIVASRLAEATP